MIYANFKLFKISLKFKPDLFLNFLHPYPSQVAKLIGKPSLVFSDTEHAALHHKLTVPFATKIYTPSCYRTNLGEKQIRFEGYMELSYLHPNYFSPNADILTFLGVNKDEKFVIVRFVSWEAAHDFGHAGMSFENKRKAIIEMSKYAKIFISAERDLPEDLEKFRIKIPFDKIHDAIYFSSLLFGESATMASEAAVLGTPSIFMDNDGRGYTDEEESRYGLVFNFTEHHEAQNKAIEKAVEILTLQNSEELFKAKREKLLKEKIDTTAYMISEVEKYQSKIRSNHK
jgi:predicted glycosyltransferase